MTRRHAYSERDDNLIRSLWAEEATCETIAARIGVTRGSVVYRAKHLGLDTSRERVPSMGRQPPEMSQAERKRERRQINRDLLRRKRIAQDSEPIVLRPSHTMTGFPVREIEPETRALIDAALAEMAI